MGNSRYIPESVKSAVKLRDGGRCRICGRVSEYMEYDHITPHRYGAPATVDNIQLLCRACNLKKRDHSDTCPTCLSRDPSNPKAAWIPHDAVVCHRCYTPIVVRVATNAIPSKRRGSWLSGKLEQMGIPRGLVLVFAFGMIALGVGILFTIVVNSVIRSINNSSFGSSSAPSVAGETCKIVDASGRANLKASCDSLNCDTDPTTVAGKISAGAVVTKTGKDVGSSLSQVGQWVEVLHNGQATYVAATKLSCK